MARTVDPEAMTRVHINGTAGNVVMTSEPFETAYPRIVEAATQHHKTEGRGRWRRTTSTLRVDLISVEAGRFKASADRGDRYSAKECHDLLLKVLERLESDGLGKLDPDIYEASRADLAEWLARPQGNGIGNPSSPGRGAHGPLVGESGGDF